MTKASFVILVLSFVTLHSSSQSRFSNETKKYIEYQDSITVFKNALLIDGKGGASRPHQTVITTNGKINWIGDDTKATIPKSAKTIDLNGKALMPGLVMLHEHMYISAHEISTRYLNLRQISSFIWNPTSSTSSIASDLSTTLPGSRSYYNKNRG